jgi:murein DD-endopeptidase MepM/ murein hydrolase activator NlpD
MANILIILVSLLFIGSAVFRALKRKTEAGEEPENGPPEEVEPGPYLLFGVLLPFLGGCAVAYAVWAFFPLFVSAAVLLGGRVLAVGIALASAVDAFAAFRKRDSDAKAVRRKGIAGAVVLLCGLAGAGFIFHVRGAPSETPLRLKSPVQGEWRVVAGGKSYLTNYHRGRPSAQNYAVDLVKVGAPDASRGAPVFAPLAGTIQNAVNTRRKAGDGAAEGNLVMIQMPDGTEILLGHLMEGSIRVKRGDTVEAGQEIAACGGTGSAVEPHLHVHAERGGQAVPLLLGTRGVFAVRGDVVRF